MNDTEKEVLISHTQELVSDLIVTETLLSSFYVKKIFDQEMIEIIRAQRTPTEQVYKILELLPRRGPDAFENFSSVLSEHYSWLAVMLQNSLQYIQKQRRLEEEKIQQAKQEAEKLEREKIEAEKHHGMEKILSPVKSDTFHNEPVHIASPRTTSELTSIDDDVRAKVSSFVQRQFGQIRRIANTDKKVIERWLTEWVQLEKKRLKNKFDEAENHSSYDVLEHPDVKDKLHVLHKKLALYIPTKQKPERRIDNVEMTEENCDVFDHDDMNFDIISDQIDEVTSRLQTMENQMTQCLDYLGDRQTELPVQVHNVLSNFHEKECELQGEREKTEEILIELYNLSTKTNKLQQINSNQESDILKLKQHINKLREENVSLINEITCLERANMVHLEKEATLEELKQTKKDMETLMKIVTQENSELKQQLSRGGRFGSNHGFQRRSTNFSLNNTTQKQSPRRAVNRKKVNNLFANK